MGDPGISAPYCKAKCLIPRDVDIEFTFIAKGSCLPEFDAGGIRIERRIQKVLSWFFMGGRNVENARFLI